MIADIDVRIKNYLKDYYYGDALYGFIRRKIDKVAKYMREDL